MVLINGVKYACERCIRGHRVTTCNHSDQPLMMIKPKGRPSTTCDYCKFLRKNKKTIPDESRCTCGRLEKKRLQKEAEEEARRKGLPLPVPEKKTRKKKEVSSMSPGIISPTSSGATRKKMISLEPRKAISSDHLHLHHSQTSPTMATNGKSLRRRNNTTSSSGLTKGLKEQNSFSSFSGHVGDVTSPASINELSVHPSNMSANKFYNFSNSLNENDESTNLTSNPFLDRIDSSTSLESSVFNRNIRPNNDSSSLLGRDFLDTIDTGVNNQQTAIHSAGVSGTSHSSTHTHPVPTGRVTKEYHHIPSMTSISSLHSTQSLEHNFNLPQSPPLSTVSFSLLSDTLSPPTHSGVFRKSNNMSHNNQPIRSLDWESGNQSDNNISPISNNNISQGDRNDYIPNGKNNHNYTASQPRKIQRSVSEQNSHENTTIGLNPLYNSKKITPKTRTHVGEVIIPLDEYVPPDINGIGRVNGSESLTAQDWPLPIDEAPNGVEFNDVMNNRNSDRDNNMANDIQSHYSDNFSTTATEADQAIMSDSDIITSNPKDLAYTGLLDMLSNGSSVSNMSKMNFFGHGNNKNDRFSVNLNSRDPNNKQNNSIAVSRYSNDYIDDKKVTTDNASTRSVEVLSLTPSFMDIPDRMESNKTEIAADSTNSYNQTRSDSDRRAEFQHFQEQQMLARQAQSQLYRKKNQTSTQDEPTQSFTSSSKFDGSDPDPILGIRKPSFEDNNMFSNASSHNALANPKSNSISFDASRESSDYKGVLGKQPSNLMHVREVNNIDDSLLPTFADIDRYSGGDAYMDVDSSLAGVSSREEDSTRANNNQDTGEDFGNKGRFNLTHHTSPTLGRDDNSPISSLQVVSPPSQLLSDEGFAELDNFMTSL